MNAPAGARAPPNPVPEPRGGSEAGIAIQRRRRANGRDHSAIPAAAAGAKSDPIGSDIIDIRSDPIGSDIIDRRSDLIGSNILDIGSYPVRYDINDTRHNRIGSDTIRIRSDPF